MSKVIEALPTNSHDSSPIVSIAYLQAPVSFHAIGVAQVTELSPNKTPGVVVSLVNGGLMIRKGELAAFIPGTNVKIAILK